MRRLTVANYLAKATKNESAQWGFWSRRAGFRSVGEWLETLANREVREREREGGYGPPSEAENPPCPRVQP